MLPISAEYLPYISIATPPLLGAAIGYLTNKIAIRMLFRPLRKWTVGPIKIPMTPGVIPAKRHQLATNIGAMVGEQLLTSDEINKALLRPGFQDHLGMLVEAKLAALFRRDLGPLPSIVPPPYRTYFDIGARTVSYQVKDGIHQYLASPACEELLAEAVTGLVRSLLARNAASLFEQNDRQREVRTAIEELLHSLFESRKLAGWLKRSVREAIERCFREHISLHRLLPEDLQHFLVNAIGEQTPYLLDRLVGVIRDDDIREQIVGAIVSAIEQFIDSLGPMVAGMARGFLKTGQLEEKVRAYLQEKDQDIATMLRSDAVRNRVAAMIKERSWILLQKPLDELLDSTGKQRVVTCGEEFAEQMLSLLKNGDAAETLAGIASTMLRTRLEEDQCSIGELIEKWFGGDGAEGLERWLTRESVQALRSSTNWKIIDSMVDDLFKGLLAKPIGRLDHIIPAGVRDGLYRSIQEMATKMLLSEVPGVVASIDIRRIVTEKIDSFDVLKVEQLLMDIMREQFKYINIFGALIGFMIGCANLILFIG